MKIYFTNAGMRKFPIKRVFEKALQHLSQPTDQLEMSVAIVTPEQIQYFNKEYRQVDAVTDVLSFPMADLQKKVVDLSANEYDSINPETNRLNLGDVLICEQRAKQQAQEYGHGIKREICFLALHGLLHLLGYDHIDAEDEQEMTALQTEILKQAGINR